MPVQANPVRISSAEWEVMEILWAASPDGLLLSQVLDAMPQENSWATKTVQTFLKRLIDKGVAETVREGRMLRYSVAVSHADCIKQEADSFLGRVFQGRVSHLLAHFIEEEDLNQGDIDDLRRILEEKRK